MKRQGDIPITQDEPTVTIPARDYGNLLAARRQLGAQNARLRSLRQTLGSLVEYVELLEGPLVQAARAQSVAEGAPPQQDAAEAATELGRRLQRARAMIGPRG